MRVRPVSVAEAEGALLAHFEAAPGPAKRGQQTF